MGRPMNRTAVIMQAPYRVGVCREEIPLPEPGEIVVQCRLSAISAGTELLFYRGQVPPDMTIDSRLSGLTGPAHYPLRYGYAAVGEVTALGPNVSADLLGRRVFCFHPHASHATVRPVDIVPLPGDIADRDALFLANMETAVTLVLDGRPAVGEAVAVLGQGTVGLLAAALLARHPLHRLFSVDPIPRRRAASLETGAHAAFDPRDIDALKSRLESDSGGAMADLVFELSGDPSALNAAIDLTGFGGRIVIGSWYGTRPAAVDLGGRFHRSRIRLISSQVSTLPAHAAARWDKARRIETAWEMIRTIRPSRYVTHEMPVEHAADAYELLDRRPWEAIQVVLTYGDG
jgi:2-desacetyl-2-hydroxyethyl bacteriochlorophyllide A dehydrogenase